jgi:uncharacterized protein (TIGR02001 family)
MSRFAQSFRLSFAALTLAVTAAAPAMAADQTLAETETSPLWDVSFGTKVVSDYVDRGYSNSNGNPAVQGYVELSAFDWIYLGVWSSSVSYPERRGLTDPAAEVDFYAGLRHSWDAFSLDVGALYYDYPGEKKPYPGAKQTDYYEVAVKPSYVIGEVLTLSAQAFWSGDYANTGSNATFVAGGGKLDLALDSMPELAFYVSGELGYQWLGKTSEGFNPADYLTWNAGVGATYKAMTIDLRYSGADLSESECVGVSGARSWCGNRVMASIAFDTSLSALK